MDIVTKHGKGKAATFRRYPAGQYKEYDREYLWQRADSNILNAGNRSIYDLGQYDNLPAIDALLFEYLGDDQGEVTDRTSGKTKLAIIPSIYQKLAETDARISKHRKKRVEDGFPAKTPRSLQDEKLRIEAYLDVCGAEVEWLEKKKKEIESKRDEETRARVLKYGPICSQSGSPAKEIDGQKVSLMDISGNTVPVIDDNRSPYDGMKLSDYRKMASDWMQEKKAQRDEKKVQRDKEIQLHGKSDIFIPMSSRTVSKENLPAWPDGVKNIKK